MVSMGRGATWPLTGGDSGGDGAGRGSLHQVRYQHLLGGQVAVRGASHFSVRMMGRAPLQSLELAGEVVCWAHLAQTRRVGAGDIEREGVLEPEEAPDELGSQHCDAA